MKNGLIISDTHFFAKRSRNVLLEEKLFSKLKDTDFLVLNGDIFDFRWSQYPSLRESVDHAHAWIVQILESFKKLKIIYILGNHDYSHLFIEGLNHLKKEYAGFNFFKYFAYTENCLFLHGDCVNHFTSFEAHQEYRNRWANGKRWLSIMEIGYETLDFFHLPRLIHTVKYAKQHVAKRILHFIQLLPEDNLSQIKNIYFGHTHLPMESFLWDHHVFANSGSTIKGFQWRIIPFTLKESSEWKGI